MTKQDLDAFLEFNEEESLDSLIATVNSLENTPTISEDFFE